MPRPRKCRRVCRMPETEEFFPRGRCTGTVHLSVDEFEALRLLDYDGMTQEQCALQMKVARATVANIYASARHKLAEALVCSRRLVVSGGSYVLCETPQGCCGACGSGRCASCQNTACANHPSQRMKRETERNDIS